MGRKKGMEAIGTVGGMMEVRGARGGGEGEKEAVMECRGVVCCFAAFSRVMLMHRVM